MAGNLVISTLNSKDISSSLVATESQVIGVGQTWQDVTASRASGVTYTNSTGKAISISVSNNAASGNAGTVIVGGVTILVIAEGTDSNQAISFIVPNGVTYRLTLESILIWAELR